MIQKALLRFQWDWIGLKPRDEGLDSCFIKPRADALAIQLSPREQRAWVDFSARCDIGVTHDGMR